MNGEYFILILLWFNQLYRVIVIYVIYLIFSVDIYILGLKIRGKKKKLYKKYMKIFINNYFVKLYIMIDFFLGMYGF